MLQNDKEETGMEVGALVAVIAFGVMALIAVIAAVIAAIAAVAGGAEVPGEREDE